MESILVQKIRDEKKKAMAQLISMFTFGSNKKGQGGALGMNFAKGFILGLVVVITIALVGLVIFNSLGTASLFPTGSQPANDTAQVIGNGTAAIKTITSNAVTWAVVTALVILVIILSVALFVVLRIGRGGGG